MIIIAPPIKINPLISLLKADAITINAAMIIGAFKEKYLIYAIGLNLRSAIYIIILHFFYTNTKSKTSLILLTG